MLSLANSMLLMVSLFNAGLAIFILRGQGLRATSVFLGTFLAALCIWPLALIGSQIGPSYEFWLYSAKLTYIAGLIIAASFYLFSIAFPEDRSPKGWIIVTVFGVVAAYSAKLLASPTFLVRAIVPQGTGNAATLEPTAFLLFVGIFCFLYVGGLVRIVGKYRHATGLTRKRLLVIGLGAAITGIGGLYFDIILASPFVNDFRYIWTGPLFNTATAALIVYAVFRLGLLNAKVLAAEVLIALLWIFTLLRTLLAVEPHEQLLNGMLFVLSLVIGGQLIKSAYREKDQQEALEIANVQQERLLHFISHEVKGYLAKSAAAFDAFRTGEYDDPQRLHAMAAIALADTRKGVETVTDILDASNLKRGTVGFRKEAFDVATALNQCITDLKPAAEEKGLTLSFRNDVSGTASTVGDAEKLTRHVFRNLIDNAIKYTPEGTVTVTLDRRPAGYRITVADTGVGITLEDMEHLFTEGGRGRDAAKVNAHSTGYGLYIAKQIVEAHAGTIRAESDGARKGTRIVVELPSGGQ